MNTGMINGFEINGAPYAGENALLSGGTVSTSSLVSSAIIGIVLTGGLFTASDAEGQVSTRLFGGTSQSAFLNGSLKLTTNLIAGIHSGSEVGSLPMGQEPSLREGIHSPSGFGGQIIASARLRSDDQVGQHSILDGTIHGGLYLGGGVVSYSYVSGNIIGSIMLMADGLKSSSLVSSATMVTDRTLSGGLTSVSGLGGACRYSARLSGGFLNIHQIGKELDISAMLQGPIYQTHRMGGTWCIDMVGHGGLESSADLNAKQQLSPSANGGIHKTSQLAGQIKTRVRLHQGMASSSVIGGKGVTASQVLRGGIAPIAGTTLSAYLKTNVRLQGALVSPATLHGDIVQGFLDPLVNTWALEIRSATVLLEIKHPLDDI